MRISLSVLIGLWVLVSSALAAPPSPPLQVDGTAESCVWWYQTQCTCPVRIKWTEPEDDGGYPIMGYWIYRDGSKRESVPAGTWQVLEHEPQDTVRTWTVAAINGNNEVGEESDPVILNSQKCDDNLRPTEPGDFEAFALDCGAVGLLWNASVCPKLKSLTLTATGWRIHRNGLWSYRLFRTPLDGRVPALGTRLSTLAWPEAGDIIYLDDSVQPGFYQYAIEAHCNSGTVSTLAISALVEVPPC